MLHSGSEELATRPYIVGLRRHPCIARAGLLAVEPRTSAGTITRRSRSRCACRASFGEGLFASPWRRCSSSLVGSSRISRSELRLEESDAERARATRSDAAWYRADRPAQSRGSVADFELPREEVVTVSRVVVERFARAPRGRCDSTVALASCWVSAPGRTSGRDRGWRPSYDTVSARRAPSRFTVLG